MLKKAAMFVRYRDRPVDRINVEAAGSANGHSTDLLVAFG
jgi:hypothetical protein